MAAHVQEETLRCRLAGMMQNQRHSAVVLNIAMTVMWTIEVKVNNPSSQSLQQKCKTKVIQSKMFWMMTRDDRWWIWLTLSQTLAVF